MPPTMCLVYFVAPFVLSQVRLLALYDTRYQALFLQ